MIFEIRQGIEAHYGDILTVDVKHALAELAKFEPERRAVMDSRLRRRSVRARHGERITFLDPSATIARTHITVEAARRGDFTGSDIPRDLERQWIQGTGPAARPRAPIAQSLRSAAYALLSGADGWMFDGEDALGQVSTMSLDNQRCLKMAIDRAPQFLRVAEAVAGEMNRWSEDFFNHPIVEDWQAQL